MTAVVFDLDNTLYAEKDAKVAGECAIAEALTHDLATDVPTALDLFIAAKSRVLARRDLGPLRGERWRWVNELLDDEPRARELHDLYWDTVLARIVPYADALIALPLLRQEHASLWIATNEHEAVQARKLATLELAHHFDGVISADTVGHEKPSAEFFAHLADVIGHDDAGDVLFVGDNPNTDIVGACAAGHRTAWLRRGEFAKIDLTTIPGCTPTHQIDHLTELVALVR
ncbi:MAG TPA: HAD family hydrolase [Acidimicrobiales bacterium]|nr:HAD family hydrolase [Acidimicrobiales bacterium]